ncbi:carcinoembryonic antigen-related cell adhesion molecule 1-like [Zalophus californianus]|uniref:Carcinoembryonic antigen-related cell adhesion molecule 1-like n=1 Tax=Zalophus californianus TaxID=9704 RepID=A0A6J2F2X9_ZALCA|nr:carcinoembryonic antigen-related cell adhesion molecule 1-like [Zalophus californianus]
MEPPSAPPRRGRVPWQELLLAVSLLTFWNPPTTAQVTVESVPPNVAEGKDVLLRVNSLPGDLVGLSWFKGKSIAPRRQIVSYVVDTQVIIPGPAHSGRETIYPNGSLLFQNVTLNDTGYYTLQTVKRNVQVEQVTGQLRVFPGLPKPNITSNNSDPVENVDSVVLTCGPQTQSASYLWSVNNKSLPASTRLELSLDNRTLTIRHVTRNDTGPYECEIRNPGSAGHSDPFTLNVLYGPDAPTISPSDSYHRSGANLSLSCHAASNPPAQYSWFINGKPQPFTQKLFIPNITANDGGSYTCLAYNSGTRLNKTTVKTITVSEPISKPSLHASNTTVTEDKDSVVLTCSTKNAGVSIHWFFNGQSLKLTERMKLSQDNRTLTIDPVRREDAGTYQCEVSSWVSSSKSDPIRLDVSYERSTTGLPVGSLIGIAVGVLVGLAL